MTKVLALDQSSSVTGVAVGSSTDNPRGGYLFGSITAPKRPEFGEKLAHIFREVDKLIVVHKPDLLAYESPFFPVDRSAFQNKPASAQDSFLGPSEAAPRKGATFSLEVAKALQKVAGCVQTVAAMHGVPVEEYAAATWRKTLLGRGRFTQGEDPKRLTLARIKALGYDATKFDESDALGILFHSLHGQQAAARAQGDLMAMARL